jgi:hypothetical protein
VDNSYQPAQARNLRRLRILAVILIVSNVAIGGIGVHTIRRLDREYSLLIDSSVPVLDEIRGIGRQTGLLFRMTVTALVATDPAARSAALQSAREAQTECRKLRAAVQGADFIQGDPELVRKYAAAGKEYDAVIDDLLPRITAEDTVEQERRRVGSLLGAYDRLSILNETISATLASRSEELNTRYSMDSNRESKLLLGLAGWPILLAVGFALMAAMVASVLVFVFWREVIADEP